MYDYMSYTSGSKHLLKGTLAFGFSFKHDCIKFREGQFLGQETSVKNTKLPPRQDALRVVQLASSNHVKFTELKAILCPWL